MSVRAKVDVNPVQVVGLGFVVFAVVACIGPAPSIPIPSEGATPVGSGDRLEYVAVQVAWSLAQVGAVLAVVGFAVAAIGAIYTAIKTSDQAIAAAVEKAMKKAKDESGGAGAMPGFPFGDIFRGIFQGMGDLIKTPAGIGVALLVLSVILITVETAVRAGYTDSSARAACTAPPTPTSSPPPTATTASPSVPDTPAPATPSAAVSLSASPIPTPAPSPTSSGVPAGLTANVSERMATRAAIWTFSPTAPVSAAATPVSAAASTPTAGVPTATLDIPPTESPSAAPSSGVC
jgi:hypothetical protein